MRQLLASRARNRASARIFPSSLISAGPMRAVVSPDGLLAAPWARIQNWFAGFLLGIRLALSDRR